MERRYVSMAWRDALFAHWPVDAAVVEDRLPPGLTVRTHDDSAWLGIVAFVMEDIRPRGVPGALGFTFGEVNLRTYVEGPDGGEGIYFFNLDAADRISVRIARQFYRLPYYRAHMEIDRHGAYPGETGPHERRVDFVSHRAHAGEPDAYFDAGYGPDGDRSLPETGSLERFLVENYRFYLAEGDVAGNATDSGLFYGDVEHLPWGVYEADLDLRSTNLFEVNGFERPDTDPLAHYSPGVAVDADRVRRVD
ncbi:MULTISPECIES: YqjF family protein [Halolamina]|uniref:DUF2071 domain-containing protein n=1 Tax=Halolamina pelagica TaxID=699431 RepID=A0A1I5MPY0_9EURY|nr:MULTISPECIES: DUF2071 domain-containing protein [Halolamina]NHX36114.1 DUF2071 domain-containing protein [Halolamina sp. R1-12]SFP11652.1 hypothetical protein SAMN05216277_101359 [Halolamina pelagica]